MIRAFYSVVQYVPDGSRAEAANAGVVLYVPSAKWIDIRPSPTLERVRKFFAPGKLQLRRLELALEALRHRLVLARDEFADERDFAQFVAARADALRLTAPRLVMVRDPMTDLIGLYEELVGDSETEVTVRRVAKLPTRVAEVFSRLVAEKRAWQPGSIVVPTVRRRFDVSLAYQNGVVSYVRAESLTKRRHLDYRLERLGFNGQLIHQHPVASLPSRLVVLSTDRAAAPETEKRFEEALAEFHVRFVPASRAEDFAAEVEQSAH